MPSGEPLHDGMSPGGKGHVLTLLSQQMDQLLHDRSGSRLHNCDFHAGTTVMLNDGGNHIVSIVTERGFC